MREIVMLDVGDVLMPASGNGPEEFAIKPRKGHFKLLDGPIDVTDICISKEALKEDSVFLQVWCEKGKVIRAFVNTLPECPRDNETEFKRCCFNWMNCFTGRTAS